MKVLPGAMLAVLVATNFASASAGAVAPDLKITKITKTKLDSGTCALNVHFKDKSPESVDGNDSYSLSVSPSVVWDGQWFSDHFLVYPCSAFKKGKTYTFVVQEWDDDGTRQKVVSESPAFKWKRK